MNQQTQSIIMIVLMVALMYFMLIRPQQKKEKQTNAMRAALKPGDEVVTIGGFIGKIIRIKDDIITIEVGADRTKMDIAKWGISGLVNEVSVPQPKQKKEAAEAPEDTAKPSPKNIKKLGKKEPEAEVLEPAAPAAEEAANPAEEQ